jgi:hypothetical protein
MHFGLVRHQLGEDAAETEGVFAERRAHPVVAGGCGVALVVDQVDDSEHRLHAGFELGAARHLERHVGVGERLLGAHDALRHGRLSDQEGTRDLVGGEAAEQAQGEGHARLRGEHRMAGDEHQAQEIVADRIVDRRLELFDDAVLLGVEIAGDLLMLHLEALGAAEVVDRAVLGGRHQPGARVVRDTRHRPLLEGDQQSVLRQLLGEADVAHDARQTGDQTRRFDAPDGVDRAVGCGLGIGRRHGDRSQH